MASAQSFTPPDQYTAASPWVLLVESDFLQAADVACALEDAGLKVMGPCSTDQEAHEQLGVRRPDAALLNIGHGSTPSFQLAALLRDKNIPFAFITGYDRDVIPSKFASIPRLQKPATTAQIIAALRGLVVWEPTENQPC